MKNYIILIMSCTLIASCSSLEVDQTEEEQAEVVETVSEVDLKENDSIIRCSGVVGVKPESNISMHSPIDGLIKSIKVIEGEHVKKGEILATLEHLSIIQMQEDFLAAKSEFEYEKKNVERKTKLYTERVISEKEFDQSQRTYQSSLAHYEGLKKQLTYLGISTNQLNKGIITSKIALRSPINGFVANVIVNNGQFAAQNTKLFELMDDSHKHVHLKVFAEDAARIKEGQTVMLKTADSGKASEAEVFMVGKSIQEGTNNISVHAHLKSDSEELAVGTFVFAEIAARIDPQH